MFATPPPPSSRCPPPPPPPQPPTLRSELLDLQLRRLRPLIYYCYPPLVPPPLRFASTTCASATLASASASAAPARLLAVAATARIPELVLMRRESLNALESRGDPSDVTHDHLWITIRACTVVCKSVPACVCFRRKGIHLVYTRAVHLTHTPPDTYGGLRELTNI